MTRLSKLVLVATNQKDSSGTTRLVSSVCILSILISKITVVLNVLAIKHSTLIHNNVKIVLQAFPTLMDNIVMFVPDNNIGI